MRSPTGLAPAVQFVILLKELPQITRLLTVFENSASEEDAIRALS